MNKLLKEISYSLASAEATPQDLLDELLNLRQHLPTSGDGICHQAPLWGEIDSDIADIIYREWPHYSTNPHYPVPTNLMGNVWDNHDQLAREDSLWAGNQRKLRIDLLNHLINTLESLL